MFNGVIRYHLKSGVCIVWCAYISMIVKLLCQNNKWPFDTRMKLHPKENRNLTVVLTVQLRKQITYRLLCKTPTNMDDINQFSSVLKDIDDKRETIQMQLKTIAITVK